MNYFDYIENGLNIEINSNLERSFSSLSIDKIVEFYTYYRDLKKDGGHPFSNRQESCDLYRPLFNEHFLGRMTEGENFFGFGRDRFKVGRAADLLYSLLIFSDELILVDPLYLYGIWFEQDAEKYPYYKNMQNIQRRKFLEFLKWLRAIRPIYEMGKVSFYNVSEAHSIRFATGGRGIPQHTISDTEEQWFFDNIMDGLPELIGLSNQLNADVFLNHELAVEAYIQYMNYQDKGVRSSKLKTLEDIGVLLNLDLPVYSMDSRNEFVKILEQDDTIHFFREVLQESFEEIQNMSSISNKATFKELKILAQERIDSTERKLTNKKMLKETKFRFQLWKTLASIPNVATFLLGWEEMRLEVEQLDDQIRTIGFLKSIT